MTSLRVLILFAALAAAFTVSAARADMVDSILKDPKIVSAALSKGPCNQKISFAKREITKSGKTIVDQLPLTCRSLLMMTMGNGRLLFTFFAEQNLVGFGSDGSEHKDERGRSYVEIDHFYPPKGRSSWGWHRQLGAFDRCLWAPHKNNDKLTVVLCAVDFSPLSSDGRSLDTSQHYSWTMEITAEQFEVIKQQQTKGS